jgi:membrane protein implicated in regulation of membrane protease activity
MKMPLNLNWNWVLVVMGAVMVLVEAALGGFAGFDLVLIGSSFVLGGALGLLTGNATVGFITASALCVLYIVAGRRWVRARLKRPSIATNTDALIGQRALVTQVLSAHQPGQVSLRGEVWRARPAPDEPGTLEAGVEVLVESIDGVTLTVRRIQ